MYLTFPSFLFPLVLIRCLSLVSFFSLSLSVPSDERRRLHTALSRIVGSEQQEGRARAEVELKRAGVIVLWGAGGGGGGGKGTVGRVGGVEVGMGRVGDGGGKAGRR